MSGDPYLRLRAIVTGDGAYAALPDAEAAAAINAATVQRARPIPAVEVKKLWGQRMVLAAAKIASEDAALPAAVRVVCLATYDNLMGDLFSDLDPADPAQAPTITEFLDGLQVAGVLTDAVRAETLALAQETVSLAASIGWPAVTEHDIAHARSLTNGDH